jgi:DNA-binding MarR family transcriptional regulator
MTNSTLFLSVELNKLVNLMRLKAEVILKNQFGIDYSQLQVLRFVSILDKPNQQGITELINFSPAGVSKLIDKLEAMELLTKTMDKTNRRSNLIVLTPKGKNILVEALPILDAEFNKYIKVKDKEIMGKIVYDIITQIQK